jgi:hypothetical protein
LSHLLVVDDHPLAGGNITHALAVAHVILGKR